MILRTFITSLFFTGTFSMFGQESVPISRQDVMASVSENNTTIKISIEEFNQARAEYRQTNAIFLPNISASYTGISTTNPLMAFGSKLNQEILTQNDFDPALLNDPNQIQNFATTFEIQQPLINVDGFYHRAAAKSKMEAMSLKRQRTADFLEFEVSNAYMQLQLAYKIVDVLNKAYEAAKANKKLADNGFRQGLLQRADVLNVEVRLNDVKNQLQHAESNINNASNYISFLMNDDSFLRFRPTDSLTVNSMFDSNKTVSENRSDIKAMQLGTQALEAMNKADNMAFLPRLNAFGSYQLYDDDMFQADANGYVIGAKLSWDIFQGSKRFGKAQKSKAEFEKSKLQYDQYLSKSKLEFNKAQRMFIDAKNKLDLTALALKQSEESLRIRTNRFKEGLEKTSDLLMAETQYAQKQLEYYQTIFEYNYALNYLEFLTRE
ncbi:TolC family protein [Aestuariivivens sediminicola]|uniref:TolC family protein n=1 Tax=Aestuariivivens sediminicola TaxID=2913560 RepID=UPI001F569048|nr:TolC family protein [Aestuariivivens sediminicola]